MSPEQAKGEVVDNRGDIWSFGVVLYEMITGELPFKGDYDQSIIYSILNEDSPSVKELRPEVPNLLEQVVQRALQKESDSRFSSIDELLQGLRKCQSPLKESEISTNGLPYVLKLIKKTQVFIPAILIIAILVFFIVRFLNKSSKERWARFTALPDINRFVDEQKYMDAFLLVNQVESIIPDDPILMDLKNKSSASISIHTTPVGADIYFKDYLAIDSEWQYLGKSPIDNIEIPRAYLRWQIVKEGFQMVEGAFPYWSGKLGFTLTEKEKTPNSMVHIPAGRIRLGSSEAVQLQAYWLDKHEVTNRQYKEFVDAGGYQNREYWKEAFIKDGRTIEWEEAVAEFRDATGRPGPSTWELGSYRETFEEYPVQGVSWYEAAAYADFTGKRLPTVYHWRNAAGFDINSEILLLSNFEGESSAPVGTYQGISPYGNFDMAGNVSEWCWNESDGQRYILGGAWNDPSYQFNDQGAHSPFRRSETYGFRCVKSDTPYSEETLFPVTTFTVDYNQEYPIGDDLFDVYRNLYTYDRTELQQTIESIDEKSKYWRKEKISFQAAYGGERVIAYLFLPKNVAPPYQTVVFFPGGDARGPKTSENLSGSQFWDFIPRSGRAFLYPVYQDTYERRIEKRTRGPNSTRDLITQWSKDVQRSVDYLETRRDIDIDKLAFYGLSLGSTFGSIYTAIEQRFKISVFVAGGLYSANLELPSEVNPLNFLPRSRVPILMINGRYDFTLPLETSVKPMFKFLGTQEKDKRLALFDGDHIPPINDVIRETLNWLDRYLGPVNIK
jgi:formylglycine-generating enzyme required for sulfatase activity